MGQGGYERGQPETAKRAHCAKRNRAVRTDEDCEGELGRLGASRS